MIVDSGDLDAGGASISTASASGDVVWHRGAVGADEISAQALRDNGLGRDGQRSGQGIAAAKRIGPQPKRIRSRFWLIWVMAVSWTILLDGLVSNAADLKCRERGQRLCRRLASSGSFVQEHRGELIADGLGVRAAVGQQSCRRAVQPRCDRCEEDVLGARRSCALEPLRRNAFASSSSRLVCGATPRLAVRPRRRAPEPFHARSAPDFVRVTPSSASARPASSARLCEQAEDEVLGAQVVVAVPRAAVAAARNTSSRPFRPDGSSPPQVG